MTTLRIDGEAHIW